MSSLTLYHTTTSSLLLFVLRLDWVERAMVIFAAEARWRRAQKVRRRQGGPTWEDRLR